MNKFHQIPTDTFVPISHDNSYLFNHYDKVANFLAFNLEINYKKILAKPVQNGYEFDWFSVYENLKNINEQDTKETETSLLKYWEFIEVINAKISQLSLSNDENNKNWANLLTKVFNHNDNFIFSNGKDICIVWGWKFDNNQNYKPNFTIKTNPIETIGESFESQPEPTTPNVIEDPYIEDPIEEEILQDYLEEEIIEKTSFLEFLKWFASTYWWLLWLLTVLIALVFLIKSFAFEIN